MLQIRKEQMRVFDTVMLECFIEQMMLHLQEIFPDKSDVQNNGLLRGQIIDGIQKAAAYDINSEQSVALYITLMLGIGADFEKQEGNEWIALILQQSELEQQAKMDLIYAQLQP